MFNGKRALVTGSSRGIGRAIAVRLAEEGYEVIVHCAGNIAKAEETRKIIESSGGKSSIVTANLCNTDETVTLAEKIGNIDVLVLNASVQYRNRWDNISARECDEQLNCNFVSSLILIQKTVPYMKERGWGRIITIGSV